MKYFTKICLMLLAAFTLNAAPLESPKAAGGQQNTSIAKVNYISMDGNDQSAKRGSKGKKFRTFYGASLSALPWDWFEFDPGVYEATNIDLTLNWNFRGNGDVLLKSGDTLFSDNNKSLSHTNIIEGDQLKLEARFFIVETEGRGMGNDYTITFNVESIYSPTWTAMYLVGGTNTITVNGFIGAKDWAVYNWDSNVILNAPYAFTESIDPTEDVYLQGGSRPSVAKGELNIGFGSASFTDFMGIFAGSCKLTAQELSMANGIFSTDRADQIIIDCPKITVGPRDRDYDNTIIYCAATNYIIRNATITQTNAIAPNYAIQHNGGTLTLENGSITAANNMQIQNMAGTVITKNFLYDTNKTQGIIINQ